MIVAHEHFSVRCARQPRDVSDWMVTYAREHLTTLLHARVLMSYHDTLSMSATQLKPCSEVKGCAVRQSKYLFVPGGSKH